MGGLIKQYSLSNSSMPVLHGRILCLAGEYEVIEKAITGNTAALLAVQERHNAYIDRLRGGNADMKEWLNAKLLMAVIKFRMDYHLPHK